MNRPSMRQTLSARVKIRLIQALYNSLDKWNFDPANGQVFLLRFGRLERRDKAGKLIDMRVTAGFHFGHRSRLSVDGPLVTLVMTKDQWGNVLANVAETNSYLSELEQKYEEVNDD